MFAFENIPGRSNVGADDLVSLRWAEDFYMLAGASASAISTFTGLVSSLRRHDLDVSVTRCLVLGETTATPLQCCTSQW